VGIIVSKSVATAPETPPASSRKRRGVTLPVVQPHPAIATTVNPPKRPSFKHLYVPSKPSAIIDGKSRLSGDQVGNFRVKTINNPR